VAYSRGFASLAEERDCELPVEGDLPAWLDGALYRNGPGRFEAGGRTVEHWFDGLAMLRRFGFGDGVRYTNRYLRTEEYDAWEAGRLGAGQFGTAPSGLRQRLRSWVRPEATDNANVNVLPVGDRIVALTEAPRMVAADPRSLETLGEFAFADELTGHLTTAHPVRDPHRAESINYVTRFGRESEYVVYRLQEGARSRERIGTVSVDVPAYMHSFGLTARYVVLVEFPLVVHPLDVVLPWRRDESFLDVLSWEPERGTRFLVLDRDTGQRVATAEAPATFAFHHVNAFERGETLVVDVVAFEGPAAMAALELDGLQAGDADPPRGTLQRYRVPLSGGRASHEERFAGITLPRVPAPVRTREYRYAYAQGLTADADFANELVKVDVAAGTAEHFGEPGRYYGEPVPVAGPGDAEDAGVVLAVALDTERERSELVVLDAVEFDLRARAPLPHVLPFDFHGRYLRDVSGSTQ
jgi:carotenoid cleavage dioxygenase-like enzyme